MPKRKQSRPRTTQAFALVAMAIPSGDTLKGLTPFAQAVVLMKPDAGKALIYPRRSDQTLFKVAGCCGGGVRAALHRDKTKQFVVRKVTHRATETYAVWRVQ